MTTPAPDLYKALFNLSRVLAGHADLETLCHALAESLRPVLQFHSLVLVLHDGETDELRTHTVSVDREHRFHRVAVSAQGDNLGAQVWRSQQPLVVSPLVAEGETREVIQQAIDEGVRAFAFLPLSSARRRLGLLGFGFSERAAPDHCELALLERVASELAVTVESYLTSQALVMERDRMKALFEITTALYAKLPMEELFAAVSEQLSRVVAHDFAVVALVDKETGELAASALHSPSGEVLRLSEKAVPVEGLPAGEALETNRPVLVCGEERERFPSPIYAKCLEHGFRSSCSIPLEGPNGMKGVLDLVRRSETAFTKDEVRLLEQVGRQLAMAVENSFAYRELAEMRDKLACEKLYLEDEIRLEKNVGDMIGESPAFQAVAAAIQVVAPTTATVLIEGETGTGKELVARALHELSGRAQRSFIKVNCAAIPATLLESELFGHEKGSFTGAFAQKIGRFELAHQGTLFLDEVGEIPLELQSKLLRALQEQEFERLGGNRTIRVDVRVVAATNRRLKQLLEEGKFRSDLYYRLHVFPLAVPPLRERREDIPLLVRYFTQKYAKRLNRGIESIPSQALEALTRYDWPGNIRELQHLIERSVILSPGRVLQVTMPEMPAVVVAGRGVRGVSEGEKDRILKALEEAGGRVAGAEGAAARLGMRRTTLQSRMKKLGIERRYN